MALSQGVLLEATDKFLRVALDRDLRLLPEASGVSRRRFHLDRYEYAGSLSSSMVNLARLMAAEDQGAERMRRIVIDK